MLVALTLTPALTPAAARPRRRGRDAAAAAARPRRGYAAALARSASSADRAGGRASASPLLAASPRSPFARHGRCSRASRTATLLVRLTAAPGTSLPEMTGSRPRERELRAIPGVDDVGAHVGRAVTSDQVVDVNSGELWVSIDPRADYDATLARPSSVVAGYPARPRCDLPEQRIRDVGTLPRRRPSGADRGADRRRRAARRARLRPGLDVLPAQAERCRRPSPASTVSSTRASSCPRRSRRSRSRSTWRRRSATASSRATCAAPRPRCCPGIHVGSLFEEQKVFDVVVWGTPATRSSLDSVRNLLIDTPGRRARAARRRRRRAHRADPDGDRARRGLALPRRRGRRQRRASARSRRRRGAARDGSTFPLEYHAEVLGDDGAGDRRRPRSLAGRDRRRVGVFLLLQAAFGSWRLAALLFAGAAGRARRAACWRAARRRRRSRSARCSGCSRVLGLSVRTTCVLLVARFQDLGARAARPSGPRWSSGARGAAHADPDHRARDGLALLPFVVARRPAPGLELLHPMAVVVLGGLVTSTLVTCSSLPALYLRFGGRARRTAPRRRRSSQCAVRPERRAASARRPVESESRRSGQAGERRIVAARSSRSRWRWPRCALAGCTEAATESAVRRPTPSRLTRRARRLERSR